jgi:hydroxyacylglutathione hydrolase
MLTVELFTFNPVQENTYVVYNEKRDCCIIDPGCYFASEEIELADFIEKNGLKPVLLLNTHCHFDHIFGNRFIHKKYGLELHIHRLEEKVLEFGPVSSKNWQLHFDNYDGPLHFLEEGGKVNLGEDSLEVIFTPGHSPGSISFYSKENAFVISGDVLFQGSIGRTDLPGGDIGVLETSIRNKLYVLPDDVVVFSGHGPSTTIGREKLSNPFFRA